MARIELREATIKLRDGLSGTAAIDAPMDVPVDTDTSFSVKTVSLNTAFTTQIPIGARFTVAGETTPIPHVVTARTPTTGATTSITFAPALGPGTYANSGVVTFLPQEVAIKLGEGNLNYTINREFEYLLDRGELDTVRKGNAVPMDVTIDSVYEQITTGTSEVITPYDAVNGVGAAAEWVSSASDPCEPYAVDLVVEHVRNCGGAQNETTILADFRYETFDVNLQDATISSTGRCNAEFPALTRT